MKSTIFACCVAATCLAGCGGLPTSGPLSSTIMDQAGQDPRRFYMVEIDPRVVSVLASEPRASLLKRLGPYGRPPSPTIAVGDTVAVALWQAGNGGPFMSAPVNPAAPGGGGGQAIIIPDQIVAADGAISVPYAGRVRAAGRTPLQVQDTIEQRLTQQVVQPQVIVSVTNTVSNSVTVSGEDMTGRRVPLSMSGDRLMDVIASAGGAKSPVYDTSIVIARHGRTARIPMTTVVSDPQDNIYVWPGDVITVEREPNTFSVFGATTDNNQVPFGAPRLDLAQAVAKARGLSDFRADPEGVYLFRFEPPAVVSALGLPLPNHPTGDLPVLYHLNLRQANGYFLADGLYVKNHDLIYVANAPLTVTQKFFTLIGAIISPAAAGAAASGH